MKTKNYFSVTLLAILFNTQIIKAQSLELITQSVDSESELNDEQKEIYDKLVSIEEIEAIYLVSIGTLNDSTYNVQLQVE
jgi:hypothetical protein